MVVDEETQIWDRKGWGKPEDGAQEEMVRIASVEEKKEWGNCREEIGQEGFRISASTPPL